MKINRENGTRRDGGGDSFRPVTAGFPVSCSPVEGLQASNQRHAAGVLSAIKGFLTGKCISGVAQEPPSTTSDDSRGSYGDEPLIAHHRDEPEPPVSLPQRRQDVLREANHPLDGSEACFPPEAIFGAVFRSSAGRNDDENKHAYPPEGETPTIVLYWRALTEYSLRVIIS